VPLAATNKKQAQAVSKREEIHVDAEIVKANKTKLWIARAFVPYVNMGTFIHHPEERVRHPSADQGVE